MSNYRNETDPAEGFNLAPHSRRDPLHPGFVQLKDYPELIPVLLRAVNDVITTSHIDRERDAGLVEDVEWAAAAAALTAYERMAVSALRVRDAAEETRRIRVDSVAATAEVIADRVTDAAAEVHIVEEASAARVVLIAASAATEMAESIGLDNETSASVAAALVVKAVSDAAAVTASERADAASCLAQAAADAATDAARAAASTAWATELEVITDASDHHQNALETCYEVAAATAQAVLTHKLGADPANRTNRRRF